MNVTKPRKVKVLLLHAAGAFGGASKSMIELLRNIPSRDLEVEVLCPEGGAAEDFRRAGFGVHTVLGVPSWDDTLYGHYRRWRWLILLREALFLVPCLIALLRRRGAGYDIVHANDMTLLPIGILASRILHAKLVVHVRSLQRGGSGGLRTRVLHAWLGRHAAAIVAIDQAVARTLATSREVQVIHNVMHGRPAARDHRPGPVRVGIVGVLLGLKGVYEFVEAARLCRHRGLQAEFVVVGENVRRVAGLYGWLLARMNLARDVRGDLEQFIREHDLHGYVTLKGFIKDVSTVYAELDILCFPSHLDAAGRPVFEAALHGVPSIVAVREPTEDTMLDGETGICIPTSDATLLADAICRLAGDPQLRRAMGERARALALENRSPEANGMKIKGVYDRVATGD